MNYSGIHYRDIADGVGVRVGLYVSGCTRHCFNCQNVEAQSFECGEEFTRDVENKIIAACCPDYVAGLSLLGGEPCHPRNSSELVRFVRRFRDCFGSSKTIWCYTGCLIEELYDRSSPYYSNDTIDMLTMVDVLVDGPYVDRLRNPSLAFRGSENQRIIYLSQRS